ncbi:hypothetical protein [Streptomyces mesophilus]|uniref:hypothetical protein n=1 Tax=Streptomyces mesophilus TaxID=1775132 RepID=UPI0038B69B4B
MTVADAGGQYVPEPVSDTAVGVVDEHAWACFDHPACAVSSESPAHGGARVGEQADGTVGDAGAWAEEHDRHHGGGDSDGLLFVDDDDGVLVAVQVAAFDVDAGGAVSDAV